MAHVLVSESYEIRCVADAEEALASIERRRPLLVLAETRLPGVLSGFDLLRQLRTRTSTEGLAVVALTASVMKGSQERAMAAGFDGFLSKPIDARGLRKLVEGRVARLSPIRARPSGTRRLQRPCLD
jgi:CheY-like chemotaxis protein